MAIVTGKHRQGLSGLVLLRTMTNSRKPLSFRWRRLGRVERGMSPHQPDSEIPPWCSGARALQSAGAELRFECRIFAALKQDAERRWQVFRRLQFPRRSLPQ